MSIEPGVHYKITNARSELALHLADDNQSIIINNVEDTDRQVWIPALTDKGLTFQSLETGQSIGVSGGQEAGAKLVVGPPDITLNWNAIILPVFPPCFMLLLSGSELFMGFSSGNPQPGTPVSLSDNSGNRWVFIRA